MTTKISLIIACLCLSFIAYQQWYIYKLELSVIDAKASCVDMVNKEVADERDKCTISDISGIPDSSVINILRSNNWVED